MEIELDAGDEEGSVDKAYVSTRDNNVEVRYALNEAIKFSPLEEAANASASLRNQIVNYALQFVGNPYVWGEMCIRDRSGNGNVRGIWRFASRYECRRNHYY